MEGTKTEEDRRR